MEPFSPALARLTNLQTRLEKRPSFLATAADVPRALYMEAILGVYELKTPLPEGQAN